MKNFVILAAVSSADFAPSVNMVDSMEDAAFVEIYARYSSTASLMCSPWSV